MGAQTFDPARLKFLHRRHNANEVKLAVDRLKSAGFDNISIDLMFGFPGETLTEWEEDIKTAVSLEPKHISAYSLMYEEGTPLYRMLEKGEIEEIDEETSLAMYKKLIDLLTQAGYEHYEISNFARPGFRSQHNSSYWNAIPYIGIGAAAHSYSKDYRSWNVDNIHQYIQSIHDNKLPSESEYLDATTRYNDLITTALRTREGINLTKLKDEYGEELFLYLTQEAQKYINLHEMKIEDNKLSLTRKGLYISDSIMSDLIFISNIK
jgi:oxygen-independent coproporphyrinogen-3 oxidase